jgi:NAD-dependent dihydropyrimidine dehydrogenase PreA subunit
MADAVYMMPNPATPNQCVVIDPGKCKGCNSCIEACRTDVLLPNLEKGKPPLVVYPDECWFCGDCVQACPISGAITMSFPMNQRVGWKRKATGEFFRIGMKNPPPPVTRPPID